MERKVKFNEILRELLDQSGFKGNKKKFCMELGISTSTLSQYLGGNSYPEVTKLIKMSRILNISLDYLIFGESDDRANPSHDFGPIAKYIDTALSELQTKTNSTYVIATRIGEILAGKILGAAEELSFSLRQSNDGLYPLAGVISDNETLIIEQYSEASQIVSTNLQYDIIDIPGEEPAAGRFLEVVAKNINRGYEYCFLLPEEHDKDWTQIAKKFRTLLAKLTSTDKANKKCKIKVVEAKLVTGFGIYLLNDQLKKDHPFLFQKIEPFICNSYLGYVIPPSNDSKSDLVMDEYHLNTAIDIFKDLWTMGESL